MPPENEAARPELRVKRKVACHVDCLRNSVLDGRREIPLDVILFICIADELTVILFIPIATTIDCQ